MGPPEAIMVAIVVVVYLVVILWPVARICRRTGHSPWLAVLAVIPVANLALLWFIALSRWSTQPQGTGMMP